MVRTLRTEKKINIEYVFVRKGKSNFGNVRFLVFTISPCATSLGYLEIRGEFPRIKGIPVCDDPM